MGKTIEQIKNEVARECLFDNWELLEECATTKRGVTRKMNIVARRYASQFQQPLESLNTEIMVLRERIEELEELLKDISVNYTEDGIPSWKRLAEIYKNNKSLIEKGLITHNEKTKNT